MSLNHNAKDQALVVTGASGQLGHLVIHALQQAGASRIIATTRKPETLQLKGIDVRAADFATPATLDTAFKGADRLLIVSTDAIGARVAQHKAAIDAAKRAGIKHISYTSFILGPNALQSADVVEREHAETEELIKQSGLTYTLLRNNLYTDLLTAKLAGAYAHGMLAALPGDGAVGYVTREDCAHAAAASLLSTDWENQTVEIVGSEAVSYSALAAIASSVTGQPIAYKAIGEDDLKKALTAAGLPTPFVEILTAFEKSIAGGKMAAASNIIEKMTGTKAQSVANFLSDHRADFALPKTATR